MLSDARERDDERASHPQTSEFQDDTKKFLMRTLKSNLPPTRNTGQLEKIISLNISSTYLLNTYVYKPINDLTVPPLINIVACRARCVNNPRLEFILLPMQICRACRIAIMARASCGSQHIMSKIILTVTASYFNKRILNCTTFLKITLIL